MTYIVLQEINNQKGKIMNQNFYVISQNISTDTNGITLNFSLGKNNPANAAIPGNIPQPFMPGQGYNFSILNPANTDITTFAFGNLITMNLALAANT
jgi:hypothetical protein